MTGNFFKNCFFFFIHHTERTLFGRTRHVGREPEGRAALGVGVRRRTDTHGVRVPMEFRRGPGVAGHAADVGRQLSAVADILRAQGERTATRVRKERFFFFFLRLFQSKRNKFN